MLSKIIIKIVDYWVAKNIIKEEKRDIYEYGLDLIFSTIINIAMVMITAVIMKKVPQSLALLAIIIPLQSCGGGYHADKHGHCFLIMYTGWWIIIPLIPFITSILGLVIALISVIIVFTLAPVPHVNVPMSKERFNNMKVIVRYVAGGGAVIGVGLLWFTGNGSIIGGSVIAGMAAVALSMVVARVIYWRKGSGMVKV